MFRESGKFQRSVRSSLVRIGELPARIGALTIATLVAFSLGSAPLRAGTGDCDSDIEWTNPESSCGSSTWCGGAHSATVTLAGATIGATSGGSSVTCCLSEIVIPAHTKVVAGDKRIVKGTYVDGMLITRRCISPFTFLFITIGSWVCETDTIVTFGKYPIDSAQTCDTKTEE